MFKTGDRVVHDSHGKGKVVHGLNDSLSVRVVWDYLPHDSRYYYYYNCDTLTKLEETTMTPQQEIEAARADLQQAQERIARAEAELAKPKSVVPRPATIGRDGYVITGAGGVVEGGGAGYTLSEYDKQGNWFPTKQEAEDQAKLNALTKRFKDAVAEENARTGYELNYNDDYGNMLFNVREQGRIVTTNWGLNITTAEFMYFARESEQPLRDQFTDKELESVIRQVWVA